jgi:hypothetical protein
MEQENFVLLTQFCKHHAIEDSFIISLDDHSIIELFKNENEMYLHIDSIDKIEKIIRLHVDLSINIEGIDVILQLLDKIDVLENELKHIKNKEN